MNEITLIPLEQIDPNPWQTRLSENPEHVEKIMLSIAATRLNQPPTARRTGDRYQLAFGHTRLSAFKRLAAMPPQWFDEHGFALNDYSRMPLIVSEMSDDEMFCGAVAENEDRKDLDPIEKARAMKTARDDFGKTSAEIGAMFGCNAATVRGLMRLLDLPDVAKEKIRSGEISQGQARKLLTISNLLPAEKVNEVATTLAANPGQSEYGVNGTIYGALGRAKAKDLNDMVFPQDWEPDTVLAVKEADFKQACKQRHVPADVAGEKPLVIFARLQSEALSRQVSVSRVASEHREYGVVSEIVTQLGYPTACKGCAFSGAFEGRMYCALQGCHQRKTTLWGQVVLEKLSAKLKIAIYDPAEDGAEYQRVQMGYAWNDESRAENDRVKALFEARGPGLRLMSCDPAYSADELTGSRMAICIDVSPEAVQAVREERARKAKRDAERKAQEADYDAGRVRGENAVKFLRSVVVDAFAQAFGKMDNIGAMLALCDGGTDIRKMPRARKLETLRRALAWKALRNVVDWNLQRGGAVAVARHLQGVATEWGIVLPADWLAQAESFDAPVGVSVETEN